MIVISERVHPIALEMLSSYEIYYDPDLYSQRGALLRVLSRARGLIVRNKTQVEAELLAHAPHLKVVGRLGVGLDNIQTDLLSAQGIQLIVPRGANAVSVAEYVLGMLIAFQRHLLTLTRQVRQGGWIRDMSGLEIDGRTLAVIGYGATGQAVAQRAQAFHMRLRVYDPFAQVPQTWATSTLEEVLDGADVVSLHVPLTAKTFHLLNEKTLAILPHHATVINTARGELIDESQLLAALTKKHLGGAILDVREVEPPKASDELLGLANVWCTPHIAGLTEDSQIAIARYVAQGLIGVLG